MNSSPNGTGHEVLAEKRFGIFDDESAQLPRTRRRAACAEHILADYLSQNDSENKLYSSIVEFDRDAFAM